MSTGDEALEQLEQFTAFEADYAILPGKPRMMPAEVR